MISLHFLVVFQVFIVIMDFAIRTKNNKFRFKKKKQLMFKQMKDVMSFQFFN